MACVAYPQLTGDIEEGDDVVVNEQARCSGSAPAASTCCRQPHARARARRRRGRARDEAAVHARSGRRAPRRGGRPLAPTLDGMPVVCCTLHSQVAPVVRGARGVTVRVRAAGGGALPVALSDTCALRSAASRRVAAGACFGATSTASSVGQRLPGRSRTDSTRLSAGSAPGSSAPAPRSGTVAMAAAVAASAAVGLGGQAVFALRVSSADSRERHAALSHHALAVLSLDGPIGTIAWPEGLEPRDEVEEAVAELGAGRHLRLAGGMPGLPLDHMGRGPDEDPMFFAAAYAAGVAAAALVPKSA